MRSVSRSFNDYIETIKRVIMERFYALYEIVPGRFEPSLSGLIAYAIHHINPKVSEYP
jgi:hypothetical protein